MLLAVLNVQFHLVFSNENRRVRRKVLTCLVLLAGRAQNGTMLCKILMMHSSCLKTKTCTSETKLVFTKYVKRELALDGVDEKPGSRQPDWSNIDDKDHSTAL